MKKHLDDLGSVPPTGEEFLRQFVPKEIEKFRLQLADEKPVK